MSIAHKSASNSKRESHHINIYMRKIITVLIAILFLCNEVSLQDNSPFSIDPDDLYILKVHIVNKVYTDKCDCCSDILNDECSLFNAEILEVIRMYDDAIYPNESSLSAVSFFVVAEDLKITEENVYYLICSNSCSKKILKINHCSPLYIEARTNPLPAVITGLTQCYKFNIFQKLQLKLGIRRKAIYDKAKVTNPNESNFVKRIL